MADASAEIDSTLVELEHIRKRLVKIKTPQVRSKEDRGALKATALSWFRNHRVSIAHALSDDSLEKIDEAYRVILDAADRESATNTYRTAVVGTKAALVEARTHALVAPPRRTADVVPDFSPLASDEKMQEILARRWEECRRCLFANAPLAATVMMGGLLEALFVSRANKLLDKRSLFSSSVAPLDPKTKKALDLRQWTLGPYIDVAHDLKWISRSAKDVAVVLRDYRNYVHPEKERAHGIVLSVDDSTMFWEVTKSLSKELLAMKGIV